MESHLVSEFMHRTGANQGDAISCLKTWSWDLKRAITDYNDTCKTLNYDSGVPDDSTFYPQNIQRKSIEIIPRRNSLSARRANLAKSDSVDIVDYRKLSRGISRATDNVNLVSRARSEIAMDYHTNYHKNLEQLASLDTPEQTFVLPNIYNHPEPFRCFLEKDLIEVSTLNALEQTRRLNWWTEPGACRKLWPLATTGDGNCLLHAASLGMWGFHDRKLTLRTALYSLLSNGKHKEALFRRWRFQQTRFNKKAGFNYSELEWAKEWIEIVAMASPEPRNFSEGKKERRRMSNSERNSFVSADSIDDSATYESLEEIHILALAHILRRTIIVVADTVLRDLNGEAMAPIPFGGIYLPYEIDASECNRGPLLLAYDMAHFSALVTMESDSDYPPSLIPLTDHENVLLPIQFCIDPGEDFDWSTYDGSDGNWTLTEREHVALLQEYLNIVYANTSGTPDENEEDFSAEEEFEKKFAESEVTIPQSNMGITSACDENAQPNKSKAAKQLQSVAKQFGSIGKSMSKKIKKNIGSITKIGGSKNGKKCNLPSAYSTQSFTCQRILCAKLRVKRHEFQEEMIKNYMECAHNRFLESEKMKDYRESERHQMELLAIKEHPTIESEIYCINAGCKNYASSDTSYLCLQCYEKQKQRENSSFLSSAPRYGTGNSKFYTQADVNSHNSIKHMPPAKRLNELDQTLYLSNSTFYNDSLPGYNEVGIPISHDISYPHHHQYSPTIIHLPESSADYSEPDGTASIFSPGNTINKPNQQFYKQAQRQTVILPRLSNRTQDLLQQNRTLIQQYVNTPTTDYQTSGSLSHHSSYDNLSASAKLASSVSNAPQPPQRVSSMNATLQQAKPCRTNGCTFYGSQGTDFYCSKCYSLIDIENSPIQQAISTPATSVIVSSSTVAPKSSIIYPTATANIAKTNSKILSDI